MPNSYQDFRLLRTFGESRWLARFDLSDTREGSHKAAAIEAGAVTFHQKCERTILLLHFGQYRVFSYT